MTDRKIFELEFQSFMDSVNEGIQDKEGDFKKFLNINKSYREIAAKIKGILPSGFSKDSILTKVSDPVLKDLKKKSIMAIDGGQYQEEYKTAVISFSSAYLYKNERFFERYMNRFNVTTLDYNTLTISVIRQSMEYEIALKVLQQELEKDEKPDLVLFDGTFTFPDEALERYIQTKPEFKRYLVEFKKNVNAYFNLSIGNNIPSVAIIKDSKSNKFLTSFKTCLDTDYTNNFELADYFQDMSNLKSKNTIKSLLKDKNFLRFSELTFIDSLFDKYTNIRTKYVPIEKKYGIANDVFSEKLKENIIGFYARYGDENTPIFFIEMPAQFKNDIDKLTRILSSFSTYSIIEGYPQPLYIAHKKAKMNHGKIFSRINYLKYKLSDIDPEGAKILLRRKFHRRI